MIPIPCTQVKVADADLLTKWQRKNQEYKQRHQMSAHRESDTMARLLKFRQVLQKQTAAAERPFEKPAEDGEAGGSGRAAAGGAAAPARAEADAAQSDAKAAEDVEEEVSACASVCASQLQPWHRDCSIKPRVGIRTPM